LTLDDVRDPIPMTAAASRTRSPRGDPDRLTLRQPRWATDPGRNPAWDEPPDRRCGGPETFFDPDYAAFRRMLLSLASDGQKLVRRIPHDSPGATDRRLRSFLRRIDRFDEVVEARGLEPVQRWAHRLRSLVVELGEGH